MQTHEEATVYVKELDIFLTMKVLEDTPAVLSLRKLCDEHGYSYEWITGQKPHLIKTVFWYSATRRTSYQTWFLVYQRVLPQACLLQHPWHLQGRKMIILRLPQTRLPHHPWYLQPRQAKVWLDKNGETRTEWITIPQSCQVNVWKGKNRGDQYSSETSEELLTEPTRNPKTNKNQDHERVRRDPCHSDIPEWLQEFRENLVDDRVPGCRDSHASSSHGLSLELVRSADLGKHSVYTHFPKDRNCEICKRTKITRASCRRRNSGAVPRPENFGDLIAADHKVLSEGCESRNNHRYAVVGHPNGSSRIRAEQKLLRKHKGACKKSWSPKRKPKVMYIPWNLAKPVKIFPGIIVRRHHTDRKQMGLLKAQCAEWKKVRLQYCCNQVWMKNGGQIPWNALPICETFKISCLMGRLHTKDVLENLSKGPIIPFGYLVEYCLISAKDQFRIHQIGKKVLPWLFLGYALCAGGIWKGDVLTLRSWKRWTHRTSTRKDSMQRK